MATTKSGKKSVKQAERRRIFNVRRLRAMKESVKAVETHVAQKDAKGASAALPEAYKAIDKAVKRGIIKPNTASRKKSRLAQAIARVA